MTQQMKYAVPHLITKEKQQGQQVMRISTYSSIDRVARATFIRPDRIVLAFLPVTGLLALLAWHSAADLHPLAALLGVIAKTR
jgi:hypothetical protein